MHRLVALRFLLLLIVAILIGRLYQLQLLDNETWGYSSTIEENTTRYLAVQPRRGEILANDGNTLLAESVPTFSVAVRTGNLPPLFSEQRAYVLGELAQISALTSTLVLSPTHSVQHNQQLYNQLKQVVGEDVLQEYVAPAVSASDVVTAEAALLNVQPAQTLSALQLAQTYSSTLTFENPIDALIKRSNSRHYKSVVVKEDISQELALAIQENTRHIPGVVVVKGYQRRYPLSAQIPSLSHILGHIGRISECELVTENPAVSWMDSMATVLGHIATCGVVKKEIAEEDVGLLPYQLDDYIGKEGLEASYEDELRGELGVETVLVDALERPVSANRTMREVQDGNNLLLTIDIAFQEEVEHILRRWIEVADQRRQNAEEAYKQEYKPITNGVAIAMDPRNGDILAMVSLPSYDNNVWVDPERQADLQNLLSPSDPELREELERLSPLTNRSIAGQYPPGSSVKQFVGATALQKGVIEPDTLLRDPGKIVLEERGGHIFELPNSDPKDNNEITISDALKVSSNVFFASIAGGNQQAINLGPDALRIDGLLIDGLKEGLEWFRFGSPTTINLPGEAVGRVPSPLWKSHTLREPWTIGDTYNTAIGQGYMEVTPLQLLTAAASVANGGDYYRPHLVQQVTDSDGNVLYDQPSELLTTIPVEPEYLEVVREGMRRSVTEGLNVAARDDCSGLRIAGKTGTAEYGPLIPKADGTFARRSHAWFVGFAPYEQPEIAVVVLLEGVGDLEDGSATLAVPAVTQVMQSYFRVSPSSEKPEDCPVMPHD
jgi:penicillin-binding protein 2